MWYLHHWALLLLSTIYFLITNSVYARSQAPLPITYVSRLENPVIRTPSHRVNPFSHFVVTFTLHGGSQHLRLTLEPNNDILAIDSHIRYLNAEGNVVWAEPIDRFVHKVFKGSVWVEESPSAWARVGWARIYLKQDGDQPLFEGAFSVMHDEHHVQLRSSYMQTKRPSDVDLEDQVADFMVVYRDSDMILRDQPEIKRSLLAADQSCHAEDLSFNSDPNHPVFRGESQPLTNWGTVSLNSLLGLSKRQSDTGGIGGNSGGVNLKSTIGSTAGCPNTKRVALIGVAVDCSFVASFDSTESARQNVISVVNSASNVYESSFNISLGLRDLLVSNDTCPTTTSSSTPWNLDCSQGNITSRLSSFSEWRQSQNDTNAYWTLMSNCSTGTEVGLSWLGQLCVTGAVTGQSQAVSSTNIVVRTSTPWQVFAHETGHTFGAVHDCDSQTCAQGLDSTSQCCALDATACDASGLYIMNPSTGPGIMNFSPCTIGNICSALGRNSVNSDCLVDNRGVTTINPSQCGNGIVESGEECDCGGTQGCGNDQCCDATTCKFKNGAVCDPSNDSCCTNCQFTPANTVCRASTGPCDLEEKCTGTSGSCPADQHIPDGQSCGNATGLACASGQCTSRDLQCRELMGTLLNSNDTYACDSNSCTLTCASSKLPLDTCASMNQNFLDGSSCSGTGYCSNGQCQGATVGGQISSWVDSHKSLVIGVAAGVGGLLAFMILVCLVRGCCGRRPSRKPSYNAYRSPPIPPQMLHGRRHHVAEPYPPPAYPIPAYNHAWVGRGTIPSSRYA